MGVRASNRHWVRQYPRLDLAMCSGTCELQAMFPIQLVLGSRDITPNDGKKRDNAMETGILGGLEGFMFPKQRVDPGSY